MRERRLIRRASSQTMVIDAYDGETFVIELRGNVTSLRVKNVTPGRLYVFIVKMDAMGGHTIHWGSQIMNASTVFANPTSVSVFCFIGSTGGFLRAIAPGAWIR
jgi:hypothetical protein